MSKKNENGRKSKAPLIVAAVILGVLLLLTAAGIIVFKHYYGKMKYEPETTASAYESTEVLGSTEETTEPETIEAEKESELGESIAAAQEEAIERNDDGTDKVYNLLLVGVDRRDASWNGNSDAMILVSINYTDKKVMLTSFMRDTGIQLEGYGLRKLNNAYAVGGGPLLCSTLSKNFGIMPDNYAWVDFNSMKAIIDALGGVDMKLTVAEANYCGIQIASDQVVHLTGEQALQHARNRKTGGYDYARTQRQRDVLMAIVNRAKSGGFSDLMKTANAVLPYINHNMTETEMAGFLMKLPGVVGYEFSNQRVPFDGMYHSQNEFLIPDFGPTIDQLYSTIFD